MPKKPSLLSSFETRLDASIVAEEMSEEFDEEDKETKERLKSISTSSGYGSSAESSTVARESECSQVATVDECIDDEEACGREEDKDHCQPLRGDMKTNRPPLCHTQSLDDKAPLVINTMDSGVNSACSVYDTPFASPVIVDDEGTPIPASVRARRHTDMNFGMALVRNKSGPLAFQLIGELDGTSNIFVQYLRLTPCYDLASSHGAVVALDSSISIQRAFAIVLDAEPTECRVLVWDAIKHAFIGSLTLTDLVGAMHHATDEEILSKTLRWLIVCRAQLPARSQPAHLVTAHVDSSIYDLIKLMRMHGIHRVPVCETKKRHNVARGSTSTPPQRSSKDGEGERHSPEIDALHEMESFVEEPVLCWLGWKRVLRSINGQLRMTNRWAMLNRPVRETTIGMWDERKMTTRAMLIRDAIALLIDRHLTALPVLDCATSTTAMEVDGETTNDRSKGRMIDVLTKRDIAHGVVLMCRQKRKHSDMLAEATGDPKPSSMLTPSELSSFSTRTVGDILDCRSGVGVEAQTLKAYTCSTQDTLRRVIDRLVTVERKCIFMVDEARTCKAVMCVSDIVTRLVDDSEHMAEQAAAQPTKPRRMRVQSESDEMSQWRTTPRRLSVSNQLSMSDATPIRNMYTRRPCPPASTANGRRKTSNNETTTSTRTNGVIAEQPLPGDMAAQSVSTSPRVRHSGGNPSTSIVMPL